jgi:hypothetical protein
MGHRFKDLHWISRANIVFVRLCISAAAGIFYGFFFLLAGRYLFHLTEDQSFFFLWAPSATIITLVMFLKWRVFFWAWEKKNYGLIEDNVPKPDGER